MPKPLYTSSLLPQRRKQKGRRNQPNIYDEKKLPRSVSLSDTSIAKADLFQTSLALPSRSEAMEIALRVINELPEEALSLAIENAFSAESDLSDIDVKADQYISETLAD